MSPYDPALLAGLLAALLVPGHFALRALGLRPADDRLGWWGQALAAGALANGLVLFAWWWALPGTLTSGRLAAVQVTLALVLFAISRRRAEGALAPTEDRSPDAPRAERALFGAAVALVLVAALAQVLDANRAPVVRGDEAQFWGMRAQVLVGNGGLGPEYRAELEALRVPHRDYPPLDTLLMAWVHELAGERAFTARRIPLQLVAVGLLLVLAGALRRRVRPAAAAALLCLVAASPLATHRLRTGNADGLVALGLLLLVEGWTRAREERGDGWTGLAAIGLALALFAKNEALLYALAAGAVWLVLRFRSDSTADDRPRAPRAAWLALPLVVAVLHAAYNRHAGFENDLVSGLHEETGLLERLFDQAGEHAPLTARFFLERILTDPGFDGLLLALVLVGAVIQPRRLGERAILVPLGFVVLALAGLFAVYLATHQPLEWHLESSATRVVGQLLPVASLALAALLAPSRPSR